jgi:hypothetical protein
VTIWDKVVHYFAVLFAALFVLAAAMAVLLLNLERNLFSATTYLSALAKQDAYAHVAGPLSEATLYNSFYYDQYHDNPMFYNLRYSSQELQTCLQKALGENYTAIANNYVRPTFDQTAIAQPCLNLYATPPPPANWMENGISSLSPNPLIVADLQVLAKAALDQIFAFLDDGAQVPQLSLVAFKQHLRVNGVEIVKQRIRVQAACTMGENQAIEQSIAKSDTGMGFLSCNPSDLTLIHWEALGQRLVDSSINSYADNVDIFEPGTAPTPDTLNTLRRIRAAILFGPLIPMGFLLLVTLLVVRTWPDWMRWWGIPLLSAGILTLVFGAISIVLLKYLAGQILNSNFPAVYMNATYNADLKQTIIDTIGRVTVIVMTPALLQGCLISLAGFGLTLVPRFVKH